MLQLAIVIELIAVGPGPALRDAWGECALRVIDRRDGSDDVYGKETAKYVDAIGVWSRADRTITRRTLAMPEEAAYRLADRLRG